MTRSDTTRNERTGLRPKPRTVAFLVVLAVLVYAALLGLRALPGRLNPFGEQTKDRSGPAVLRSLRNLSRYEAAAGDYQVVVDLEKDAKFLPGALRGERTLFVGTGSVDAYVDFSGIASGALSVNADRTAVSVRLPHARLEPTRLDTRRSYVFAQQRGLLDRVGDFFSANPNQQQRLYVLAAQKIQDAAGASGLQRRADANTQQMMTSLMRSLGFTSVTVTYASQ